MKEIRLGIVGLGGMGGSHARSLLQGLVPRMRLAAVCDADPKKLEAYADAEKFHDAVAMIGSGAVDAVLVCTPHYSHTTIGIAVLEAGLHLLLEKPISVHKADCERLIAAHRRDDQVFAAMFNQRTDPRYVKIRELIQNGELGEIRRVNWIITNWFRTEAYYASGGWRATWKGEGGGVLLNQCPHNLDLLYWLFGMPASIRAFCALGKYHDIEVEDDVTAYMEFPNGATGVFIASTGEAPGTNRLEIAAERGRIVCEGDDIAFIRNEVAMTEFSRTTTHGFATPPIWNVTIPVADRGPQHLGIMQNFAEAILDGKKLIAPAKEGIYSVELANAMLLSSSLRETVALPIDSAVYEQKLMEWIATSVEKRKAVQPVVMDMNASFAR